MVKFRVFFEVRIEFLSNIQKTFGFEVLVKWEQITNLIEKDDWVSTELKDLRIESCCQSVLLSSSLCLLPFENRGNTSPMRQCSGVPQV
jgi:hypothetical protein